MRLTREHCQRLGLDYFGLMADATGPAELVAIPVASVGPWTVTIDGWQPPTVNALLQGHWAKRARVKKGATKRVADEVRLAGVPVATGKRRVAITVVYTNRSHAPDPDNVCKCLLDGLKQSARLIDDSAEWCECSMPVVEKGPRKLTRIVLEDV